MRPHPAPSELLLCYPPPVVAVLLPAISRRGVRSCHHCCCTRCGSPCGSRRPAGGRRVSAEVAARMAARVARWRPRWLGCVSGSCTAMQRATRSRRWANEAAAVTHSNSIFTSFELAGLVGCWQTVACAFLVASYVLSVLPVACLAYFFGAAAVVPDSRRAVVVVSIFASPPALVCKEHVEGGEGWLAVSALA